MRTGLPGFSDHIASLSPPRPSCLFPSFHKHLSTHIEHAWCKVLYPLGCVLWQPWEQASATVFGSKTVCSKQFTVWL